MLRKLVLHGVGPAMDLALDPIAPRLNLLTGDNGLGKSFLLEAAWWALTHAWHETPAVPSVSDAAIESAFDGDQGLREFRAEWLPDAQVWNRELFPPPNPALVMYARVDGSFSVWDPARNGRQYLREDGSKASRPLAYQFSASDVLEGLKRRVQVAGQWREQTLCLGLINEWREWQRAKDPRFELLRRLLAALGPDDQPLVPGVMVASSPSRVGEPPNATGHLLQASHGSRCGPSSKTSRSWRASSGAKGD